ncbi:hypothetical protein C9439_02075 [archaeon SCG-AAA382B04]|nr:hypothetical protein C9439_02075 [archaeon SCG-AAA382B04]
MAEIRINATGGLKLYDADDSHYAQIVAGTITSNVDAITLGHNIATFNAAITAGGILKTDDTTEATSTTDGSLQTDGGLSVAKDTVIGDDLKLLSDASVLSFGANSEITLTHVHDTGLLLQDSGGTPTLQLHDSNESIASDGSKVIITSGGTAFSLPTSDGSNGQALITNGSAVLSFGSAGASTIGALDDVSMDITNFTDGLLIQSNSNGSAPTTGTLSGANYNVGIGKDVFKALTSGDDNVAIGTNAGQALTSGSDNLFVGRDCGYNITTGEKNLCIGATSMGNNDAESHNMAMGFGTLNGSINGGEYNICIGNYAGDAVTSGDKNICLGHQAGTDMTTGEQMTCLGFQAGASITTGTGNTIIGGTSAAALQDGNNNTIIGVSVNVSASDSTNRIALGQGFSVGGDYDFSFGSASNVVTNDFNADADWSRSSDERLKRNIEDSTLGLDFINDLRPVKFQWKPSYEVPKELTTEYNEENKKDLDYISHGFIAQEVKEAIDKHGDNTFGGWHLDKTDNETQRVKKNMFVMPLIRAVQELSAEVKELKAKLEDK